MLKLLMPWEVDRIFRYPPGRSARLARAGKLPCVVLPDGEIRFDETEVRRLLESSATPATNNLPQEVTAHANA